MSIKKGCEIRGTSRVNCKASSKGQVTVFIIIGIVVVLTAAGILFITQEVTTQSLLTSSEPIIISVPSQFQPIQKYTESCIYQEAKRGLKILGQQGGYIQPELLGDYDSMDGMGVDLGSIKVPYWHFNSEPNAASKISFSSLKPKLRASEGKTSVDKVLSIESQLARFITQNIDVCLEGYQQFEREGFSFEKLSENKKVEVAVTEETVNVLLTRPVQITKADASNELTQFYSQVDLSLPRFYDLAENITNVERNLNFLEIQGLNLIQIFSGVNMQKLPPTSATAFDPVAMAQWSVQSVKSNLRQTLISHVPMLRFIASEDYYRYNFPTSSLSALFQGSYDQNFMNLPGTENLHISFDYFDWEPYLKMNDVNDKIKPQSLPTDLFIGNFNMQHYRTMYDLSYPVLVSIDDKKAFGGEGFQFNFALESNIRNNRAAQAEQTVLKPITTFQDSLACNDDQKDSPLITSFLVDAETRDPLELVQIGFQIPNRDECTMGISDNKGEYSGSYPSVYGGVLTYEKNEYLTAFYPIDTYKLKSDKIVGYAVGGVGQAVEMYKRKRINLTVQKKNLGKCIKPLECRYSYSVALTKDIDCQPGPEQCFFNDNSALKPQSVFDIEADGSLTKFNSYHFLNSAHKLDDDEQFLVTLTRVKGFNDDSVIYDDFTTAAVVEGDGKTEVDLYPGYYEVSMTLLLDSGFRIPEEERCTTFTVLTWDVEQCSKMQEMVLNQYVESQINWNTEKTYLKVLPGDLYGNNEIVMFTLGQLIKETPDTTTTTVRYTGGSPEIFGIPGIPTLVDVISDATTDFNEAEQEVNVFIVEDLQLISETDKIANKPKIRKLLEPVFIKS